MRGHIRQRGKKWAVVIYLGRDSASGKERHKWFTHGTRREAEAHLVQLLAQVQAGGGIPPNRLRVGNFLEQWLRDYAEGHVATSTLVRYRYIVRKRLCPAMGSIPLARLTPQGIQTYLASTGTKALAAATVLYHYRVLHEALRHAVRWGLLVRNPADFVDPPRVRKKEMKVWNEDQVRAFLREAHNSSPHYALYLSAILTGMRQGELLGLRWQDLDFESKVASVQQKFYRIGALRLFTPPKNDRVRAVALPETLVEELRCLRRDQAEQRLLLGPEYEDNNLIFCQANGKPLHAHNVCRRDFRRIIRLAGLPPIRFHDLRHCSATLLLSQGTHPKIVQERLGHSTIRVTMDTYSHVLPGMQEEAAGKLSRRLLGREASGQ